MPMHRDETPIASAILYLTPPEGHALELWHKDRHADVGLRDVGCVSLFPAGVFHATTPCELDTDRVILVFFF